MLRPKIAEKRFDTLVKPFILNNSEVWGAYTKRHFGSWDKSPAEKVHLRFCKIYLGVNSKCSNDACRANLGRMPLKLTIDRQIIKFYNHLNSMSSNTIAKQALEISQSISTSNRNCFYSYNRNLIQKNNENRDTCAKSGLNKIYQKMKNNYYDFWQNRVVHSPKLEFFTSQKSIYSQERYLSAIKKFKYRQTLSKLRLSNHSLNIEAGRYKKPKIPREQRICFLCNLSKVETESHFLFECPAYALKEKLLIKSWSVTL